MHEQYLGERLRHHRHSGMRVPQMLVYCHLGVPYQALFFGHLHSELEEDSLFGSPSCKMTSPVLKL